MPKIYLWCVPSAAMRPGDVLGYACAEDGTGLCSHLSSSETWSKHDLGLTSDWKHNLYREHYPDGYELEWVEYPDEHCGLLMALALNEARHQANLKVANATT